MLYNVANDEYCFSKKYDLHIIDRVGGGDSFGGGLIYSLLSGKDTQASVEFAVAASALKRLITFNRDCHSLAEGLGKCTLRALNGNCVAVYCNCNTCRNLDRHSTNS